MVHGLHFPSCVASLERIFATRCRKRTASVNASGRLTRIRVRVTFTSDRHYFASPWYKEEISSLAVCSPLCAFNRSWGRPELEIFFSAAQCCSIAACRFANGSLSTRDTYLYIRTRENLKIYNPPTRMEYTSSQNSSFNMSINPRRWIILVFWKMFQSSFSDLS